MADKMMRVAGRGEDGLSKAIQSDSEGNIKTINANRTINYKEETRIFDSTGSFIFYGARQGNTRNAPFYPFDIRGQGKSMVYVKNDSTENIEIRLSFFHTHERMDFARDMLVETESLYIEPGKAMIITSEAIPLLKQPFSGLGVAVATKKSNASGSYNIRLFGGA